MTGKRRGVFPNTILFVVLVPVTIVGIVIAIVQIRAESSVTDSIRENFDKTLVLATDMALDICEDNFEYLLELRLEDDEQMVQALEADSLQQIRSLKDEFYQIEFLVLDDEGLPLVNTAAIELSDTPDELPDCDTETRIVLGGTPVRAECASFPFFRWRLVAFITRADYVAPARLVLRTLTFGTGAGLLLMLASFTAVFWFSVRRPLRSLADSALGVAEGRYESLGHARRDEIGAVISAFDDMIRALQQKDAEVERLIGELRGSELRFRSAFLTSPDAMCIMNYDENRILEVNQGFRSLTGYDADEVLGADLIAMRLVNAADVQELSRRFRESGVVSNMLADIRRKDGTSRTVLLSARRTAVGDQEVVLFTGRDITELRKAEQEAERLRELLRQAQKMEAVGRLAGGVAHDSNNTLTAIIGFGGLLDQSIEPGTPEKEWIRQILDAGERAAKLTRQLLVFSRKQALAPRQVDVGELLTGLSSMLRRVIGEDITLSMDIAGSAWPVWIDPNQLEHALVNLVVNARDAMPAGGRLTITVRNVEAETAGGEEFVRIAVADTGVGMTPQTLEKVFEPFFTTKHASVGTGLGLSTVAAAIGQSGGEVRAESELGRGSTFTIELPRYDGPMDAVDGPAVAQSAPVGGSETVLLVEDDIAVRNLTANVLGSLGYRVVSAPSVDNAVAAFDGSEDGSIDLLLTDVVMPGMDGPELADYMRRRRPDLPVLFMSGYAYEVLSGRGIDQADVDLIQKPFTTAELALRVRRALDRR